MPADLLPGGSLLVDLTMSTLADQDLIIGYEVSLGSSSSMIFADGFEDGTLDQWTTSLP